MAKRLYAMPESYVVLDVETTGGSPKNAHLIEIGAVKVVNKKIVDRFSSLIEPPVVIPTFIEGLTGITNAMVANQPSATEVVHEFLTWLKDDIVVSHNVAFDVGFIEAIAGKLTNDRVDTVQLSRAILPECSSYKLSSLCHYLHVDNLDAHRALSDATATYKVYEIMRVLANKRYGGLPKEDKYIKAAWVKAPKQTRYNPLLSGKVVCVSGRFGQFTRYELIQSLLAVGAQVVDVMDARCDYLIWAGKKASKKLHRAQALMVPVIDEATIIHWLTKTEVN